MSEQLPQSIIDTIKNSMLLRKRIDQIEGLSVTAVSKLHKIGCTRLFHLLALTTSSNGKDISHRISNSHTVHAGSKSILPLSEELAKEGFVIGQWSRHAEQVLGYNVLNSHWVVAAFPDLPLETFPDETLNAFFAAQAGADLSEQYGASLEEGLSQFIQRQSPGKG